MKKRQFFEPSYRWGPARAKQDRPEVARLRFAIGSALRWNRRTFLGAGLGSVLVPACTSDSTPDEREGTGADTGVTRMDSGIADAGAPSDAGAPLDLGDLDANPPMDAGPLDGGIDCRLTPEQIEGPFFFDIETLRADMREGRPGRTLQIGLQVVDVSNCRPIANAPVHVWSADALGQYSGYQDQGHGFNVDTRGESFLRGVQLTDEAGLAQLTSLYPGWYPGRAVHVHFKVFLSSRTLVTSQFYFSEELTDAVHAEAPYTALGPRDTLNERDRFLGSAEGLIVTTSERDGLLEARLVVGVIL